MGVPAPPTAAGRSAGQGRPLRFAAAKGSSSNPQRHQHRSAPAPFVSPPPFPLPPTSPISLTSPSPPPLQLSQAPAALLLCSPPLCQSVSPSPGARILFPAPPSTCLPSQVLSKGALRPLTPLPRPKIRGIEKDRGFPSLPPPRISMVAAALWGQHRASITFRTPLTLHARLVWDQEDFGQSQTAHMENWTPVTSILVLSIQVSSCFGWL